MSTFIKFVMALTLSTVLIGCEKGPAEKAGEKIDNAVEDMRDGAEDTCDKLTDDDC